MYDIFSDKMEKSIQTLKERIEGVPAIAGDEDFFPNDTT